MKKQMILTVLLLMVPPVLAGTNVFTQSYTGDNNGFTGRVGYSFMTNQNIGVDSLGRCVTGGALNANHTIELFDVATRNLIASVTVTSTSNIDALGYAFENLSVPVILSQGSEYLLYTSETAGDGDLWKGAVYVTGGYDTSIMMILGYEFSYEVAGEPMPFPLGYHYGQNAAAGIVSFTSIAVPEPASIGLLGIGTFALLKKKYR